MRKIALDDLARRIEPDELARGLGAERASGGWRCPFPDHDDEKPSFSTFRRDGRTWGKCHGCDRSGTPVQLAAELWGQEPPEAARKLADRAGLAGLAGCVSETEADGGEAPDPSEAGLGVNATGESTKSAADSGRTDQAKGRSNTGLTVAEYAAAKKLPEGWLQQELGLTQIHLHGTPAISMPYRGPDGHEVSRRFRLTMGGDARFRWKQGTKVVPYGLWRLEEAREAGHVTLVEGESDAQTLWYHDEPALGIPGASTWQAPWADYLEEIEDIYVVIEPDTGGEAVRGWLAETPFRDQVELVELEGDVSDLHVDDPPAFKSAWEEAKNEATPWWEVEEVRRQEEAEEAFEVAEGLLDGPRLTGTGRSGRDRQRLRR